MTSIRAYVRGAVAAAVLFSASTAGAVGVSLDLQRFERSDLVSAQGAMKNFVQGHSVSNLHYENFETNNAWNGTFGTTNPKNTGVGNFKAYGSTGSGHSVVGDGASLAVRNDTAMPWGRYHANTPDEALVGGNWLDSNDNQGIKWRIKDKGEFNAISFFVVDAADVGGKFSIKVGDKKFSNLAGDTRLSNGNIHYVTIMLDEAVDDLTIKMGHNRNNDGFGIDGVMVAKVAPVPLPPAAALLFTGIAALAGIRHRRKSAKA